MYNRDRAKTEVGKIYLLADFASSLGLTEGTYHVILDALMGRAADISAEYGLTENELAELEVRRDEP